MSWDRDEMARIMEAVDNVVDSFRDVERSMRAIHEKQSDGDTGHAVTTPVNIDMGPFNESLKEGTSQVKTFSRAIGKTTDIVYAMHEKLGGLDWSAVGKLDINGLAGKMAATGAMPPTQSNTRLFQGYYSDGFRGYYPDNETRASLNLRQKRARSLMRRRRKKQRVIQARTHRAKVKNQVSAIRRYQREAGQEEQQQAAAAQKQKQSHSRTVRSRGARKKEKIMAGRRRAKWAKRVALGLLVGGGIMGAISPTHLMAAGSRTTRLVASGGALPLAGLADAAVDETRRFAAFAPGTAGALISHNMNEMMRTASLAMRMQPSSIALVNSVDAMHASMVDYNTMTATTGNYFGTFAARTAGAAFRTTAGLANDITSLFGTDTAKWMLDNVPAVAGQALGGFGAVAAIGTAIGTVAAGLGYLGVAAGTAVAGALSWPVIAGAAVLGGIYAGGKELLTGQNKFEEANLEAKAAAGAKFNQNYFNDMFQGKKFTPRPVFVP